MCDEQWFRPLLVIACCIEFGPDTTFAAETGATYQEPVSHTRQTIQMTDCLPLANTLSTTKGMTESNTSHQLTSNSSMTAIIWSQLSRSRLNRSFYKKWTIFQWLSMTAIIWSQLKTFLSRQVFSQRVHHFFADINYTHYDWNVCESAVRFCSA